MGPFHGDAEIRTGIGGTGARGEDGDDDDTAGCAQSGWLSLVRRVVSRFRAVGALLPAAVSSLIRPSGFIQDPMTRGHRIQPSWSAVQVRSQQEPDAFLASGAKFHLGVRRDRPHIDDSRNTQTTVDEADARLDRRLESLQAQGALYPSNCLAYLHATA
ncbi:hypothetical protein AYO21_11179 [Fonsecaea monophora]|uniref:Uncharacterized protein n=1 Tax=Fonsecaea monophora TaxID=254056 RepID=A0A177ERR0_9EURO|nr:hypothetical protein AYO21_11179 [Fonsecaea monophora]OAG34667.1 hypothetical protein AYO21_11179 [Fonsecaea monophora]